MFEIERDILNYMVSHPQAADTRVGITEWWMLERCIERHLREVDEALSNLVEKGSVEARHLATSAPSFRLNSDRLEEVRRIIEAGP